MHKENKNIIVFYHANCPDGFGAAWAAWRALGETAEYVAYHYGHPIEVDIADKEVYSVDLTFEGEQLPKVLREAKSYTVIDHHVSNAERAKQATKCVYDISHSGSVLTWMYFHPGTAVPKLLEYIEDNDLWHFALPSSKESACAIATRNFDFAVFDELEQVYNDERKFKDFIDCGKLILAKSGKDAGEISEQFYFIEFEGRKVPVVNTPMHVSDIGHRMAEKFPPFAIMWCRRKDEIGVSMRGDGSIDLSEISTKFGGGGHHDAAGFTILLQGLDKPENNRKKDLLAKLLSPSQN